MASEDRLRFGEFELRLDSGELFRAGEPVKLQPQPARVLELLVRRSGEVVSREDLRRHLWGEDTFVDFEHGLNFSIQQLRRALGDSAAAPRFIETVPKRGYRFLVPVRREDATPSDVPPRPKRIWSARVSLLILFVTALAFLPGDRVPTAAWDAYREGKYLMQKGEKQKALASFQQTTLLAPRFADAFTALAQAADTYPVAEAAARRALEIDPGQTEAHLVLAQTYAYFHHDLGRAEREAKLALAEDPKLAAAYYTLMDIFAASGRHEESLAAREKARLLDAEERGGPDLVCCYHLFLAQDYDGAIDCGERILRLASEGSNDSRLARTWIIWSSWKKGDPETAMAVARAQVNAEKSFPPPTRLQTLQDYWEWDLARTVTVPGPRPPTWRFFGRLSATAKPPSICWSGQPPSGIPGCSSSWESIPVGTICGASPVSRSSWGGSAWEEPKQGHKGRKRPKGHKRHHKPSLRSFMSLRSLLLHVYVSPYAPVETTGPSRPA
jgi:DNA-binding winged helix-turn-helix (wHTH) protein